ncbi:MAG: hypothetical protein Q8O99_04825 [bacterium]|nr:hypothetical protein [bacterium]
MILINDTIGFIRDLPPSLIQAFTSTLEDSIEANLLLHVIDASDPLLEDKIHIVDQILDQIGAHQPRVLVINKIDIITPSRLKTLKRSFSDAQFLSAQIGE